MHSRLYVILAIAHGILFTLNIILAVNLTPILGSSTSESLSDASCVGIGGSIGVIVSFVMTILRWDEGGSSLQDKAVFGAFHAAIVVGLLYTWYYYGVVLITGGN